MARSVLFAVLLLSFALAMPAFADDPVEIALGGIEGEARDNLRLALALPYGMVREGKVDRLWLDRFVRQVPDRARLSLEPYGYYHPRIDAALRDLGGGAYRIEVQVDPGPPVRVSEVELVITGPGAGEGGFRDLTAFALKKGDVLVQPHYERGKGRLLARAQELGYLDASFTRHEIRIAPGAESARILLTFDTGGRYYFDGARIEGAPEYPEFYLRRFLSFKSGDVFSYARLGETQLNFSNSERFREVVVTPEKDAAREYRVPVLVRLKPVARRSLRPGVGYGTDTGARFTVRFRDLNLFHEGKEIDTTIYAAQMLQGLAARYTIPSARDLKSSTAVQLNLQRENVSSYVSRLVALELDRDRSFGRGELGTIYLKLQQESFTIGSQSSGSRLVMPGLRFSKDRFDSLVRPRSGYRAALDLRGAHPFIGSDTAFVQLLGEANLLIPLPARFSLHLRGRGAGTFLSDPLADIPPSIRFFAGGDQSVRGYSYQSLGPRDASGQVVGGKNLLVGSVELERALFQKWGVSTFYDVGNAYNSLVGLHLFQSAGVGLHYYTPVGGLNLSLARRLFDPVPAYYVHFSVGFQL